MICKVVYDRNEIAWVYIDGELYGGVKRIDTNLYIHVPKEEKK